MNWTALTRLVTAGVLVGGLVGATIFGVSTTVDNAVAADAERRARDWARYLVSEMPGLERTIRSGKLEKEQYRLIREMAGAGDVFRFTLFDEGANVVLISDEMHAALEPGAAADHNGTAAEVLRTGLPVVSLESGSKEVNRPSVYAEAYIPVPDQDGNRIGVAEIYLDQTKISELFHSMFTTLSTLLAGAYALAFAGAYVAFLIKTGQAERSLKRADFLAQYDPASGVLNRSTFEAAARPLLDMPADKTPVATLYLDVDRFKALNDAHGHKSGDAFLRHVGDALQEVVGETGISARLGGGEFAVIARRQSLAEAESLALALQAAIARPVIAEGARFCGHVSIGLHVDTGDQPLEIRLHKADLALFQAKIDGGHCHRVFSRELEEQLVNRQRIEEAVATGLAQNRFSLVFQPLVDPVSGRCAGFEALLRLTDAEGAPITPDTFIPIAESTGQIELIGAWVLERAMTNAANWPEPLFVSVNLSARQFESGKLVPLVRRLLERTGLPAARLELEVTESLFITHAESVGSQLAELRDLGISVAMDDFGTGYSSLGYLWQFGFDTLKIDRSFINGISADPEKAREIIGAIIALAHRLDMTVTAEGIETPLQAQVLAELSCDLFQGFYCGRPMPETELAGFVLDLNACMPPGLPGQNHSPRRRARSLRAVNG